MQAARALVAAALCLASTGASRLARQLVARTPPRFHPACCRLDEARFGSAEWAALAADLDALPAFACVNAAGEPLEYERDGAPLAIFFADLERARAELASASAKYPSLGLRLMPIGLADAFRRSCLGGAVLVPGAQELEAASDPDADSPWESDQLPLFGCLEMTRPNADGSRSMPLFMSSREAQTALKAAAAAAAPGALAANPQANGPDGLRIVVIPLAKAVELSLAAQPASFQFIPPKPSVDFVQTYLARQAEGGADEAAAATIRAALADEPGGEPGAAAPSAGLFPD